MNRTIGILGCGWLGTPLAQELVQEGYVVKGSTTSKDKVIFLDQSGIRSFLIRLNEEFVEGDIEGFLGHLDVLIINVPPNLRKNPGSSYMEKMRTLLKHLKNSGVPNVIFVSSTSVYGDVKGRITEETVPKPITESGKQLLKSEGLFMDEAEFSVSIIRFGGLIGEDRHPVYHLSEKELKNGGELINLIHQKDGIYMIRTIIEKGYWNEIFNGVYPHHPTKSEYYTSEAKKRGIPPPVYRHSSENINKKKVIFKNFYVKNHSLTTPISS